MSYSKAVKPPEPPKEPPKPDWACFVNGCPAVGTSGKRGELFCMFHDNTPSALWAQITTGLRRREWAMQIAYALRDRAFVEDNPDWVPRVRRKCVENNRIDLAPLDRVETSKGVFRDEREHPELYAQRVLLTIRREVHVDQGAERLSHSEMWRAVSTLVGRPTAEDQPPKEQA